ncbi:hypothetical protein NP493_2227g00000 [Ridgeia piscesae]|uniref:Uncharacterized protein n=1 Tax=Ridgeia piscesae TaxID=27915 RepID=A0AAD9JK30_RIDPI|nr:hypothetical protein NP493_2227g00000 [Ridgeia piscesae]
MRYQRWYIKYHLTLCRLRGDGRLPADRRNNTRNGDVFPACCQFPRPNLGGVARISRWLCTRLLPRAEDVGDREDLGGASKMHNFVRGFQSSDARVHRRQRLHELPGDGARQQEAAVQVHLCLVRRYPTYIRSRRLRQLLVPDFPCVTLRCGDVNDYDDGEADVTFWRRMRYALTCDTEQERCRRNVEVISLLVPCQKHTEDSH